ncbi:hypothetical protein [uncultured Methanomethylovorans sp.]|uniref:hypothetical protein n=1 Tax=uncultured Methanomethylovorans sp. TaxID=183759 RepID=UPI002AA6A832|nr:hypothetical protein [uncultured Methanomethylovorans sp.]
MLAHLRIMSVINIFTSMNTTRIAEFANLPRTTNNAEILELSQVGLIKESERSTPHMTYWELTPIGIELLDTYRRLLPTESLIRIDTLKESNRENCFKIINALKESEKTKKALSEQLGIANKELELCLTFLLRTGYLQLDESNDTLYYKLNPNMA